MKKKKIILISAAVAVILCICLIVSNGFGPEIVEADKKSVKADISSDDSNWDNVETGIVTIQNDNYIFTLDCDTTHFYVQNRNGDNVYHSVAQASEGYEPTVEQQSEVVITYYDSKSTQAKMNSFENSVEHQSYDIKTDGSAIRVYYSIQKSEKKIFVPTVLSRETFEEVILSELGSGPRRRLKSFYDIQRI